MRFVLVMFLAACPSSGPKDPAYTPAGPKPCEKMADHVVGLMYQIDPKSENAAQHREVADQITRVLIDRCTKDGWTQDAQKCWIEVANAAEIEKCAPLMTVEQRDNMARAIDDAFPKKPGAGSDSAPDPGTGAGRGSN